MGRMICKHCGYIEEVHCEFEGVEFQDACVCDPKTWFPNAPEPICAEYISQNFRSGYCSNCDHDEMCHKEAKL